MSSSMNPCSPETAHRSSLLNWLSVFSVALGTFVMVTTEFLPIGLLSQIAKDFGVSEGAAGLMVTVPGIVAAIAAPAAAFGLKRIDRRWLLLALTVIVMASNVIAVHSQTFQAMLLARFLLGISVGSFWAFAGAVGRRLVDERHGATATAVILGGISIGTVLGLPLGAVIGNWVGWRAAFEVGAVLSMIAIAAQWVLLPALKPTPEVVHAGLGETLGHPVLRAGFLFAVLVVFGHFAAYTYLEPYLTQGVGLDARWLGLVLAGYGVSGLLGNFIAARFAERNVSHTFMAMTVLLSISVFGLVAAHSMKGLSVLAVIGWGIAFGAVPTCIQIWLYRASPNLFETSSALMVTIFQSALAAGAWVGGITADRFGQQAAILAGAVVVSLGALTMVAFRAPRTLTRP